MSGKEINFGTEGRALMLRGVDQLADAVSVTLGPKGRNAILDQPYGAPKITKDGVTVAKNIEFRDRFENMGAQLVRQVATRTNDAAGDGTTTATVLTRAIFAEGVKAVAAGMNPSDLRRGIRAAAQQVVKEIEAIAKPISSREEIAQVATISANSEREIGDLISEAMERVGKEGVITVNDGKTLDNELDVVEGMKFDRGYISPYFATDPKTQVFDVEDPLILLVEKKVSSIQSIVPLLETVVKAQRPLLVVAEDVESEALATLVVNKLRAGIKVCAVKAPGFGDNRRETLQDLAALTGATVVSDDVGLKLEQATLDHLGSCKRCTVSKDDAIVLDGGGARADVEARCDAIRDLIAASTSDYEREKLQERLAKLGGGVAVIKVGGASEVEVSEKKDRVVDALLHASTRLDAVMASAENLDQRVGAEIVQRALRAPAARIAENAGAEGAVVVGELLKEADATRGYDAAAGEYVDLYAAGIVDPAKVVKTAVTDAQSVAALMMTAEAFVADLPPDPSEAAAGPPGGMGGMGGMM